MNRQTQAVSSQARLRINATDSARYSCRAENVHRLGRTNVSRAAHVHVLGQYHPPAGNSTSPIGNESVPIQLAQCWFSVMAIHSAKILMYFSNKIYGSNLIKQHSETIMVYNQRNLRVAVLKYKFIVLLIISGTVAFPISPPVPCVQIQCFDTVGLAPGRASGP